jgi:archaemetzincin
MLWFLFPFCTGKPDSQQVCFQLIVADSIPASAVEAVAKALRDSLEIRAQVIRGPMLPDSVWSAERKRYRAAGALQWMAQKKRLNSTEYQLLITDKDLGVDYSGEKLRGANGLSVQGGQVGIISDYRLHQFGRSTDSVNYYLGKVALHETGHLLGLTHCQVPGCIMESVEIKQHITTLRGFCNHCKEKIFHKCE